MNQAKSPEKKPSNNSVIRDATRRQQSDLGAPRSCTAKVRLDGRQWILGVGEGAGERRP